MVKIQGFFLKSFLISGLGFLLQANVAVADMSGHGGMVRALAVSPRKHERSVETTFCFRGGGNPFNGNRQFVDRRITVGSGAVYVHVLN